MENFEQNQNIEASQTDELSTIFSDPTVHKKTAGQAKNQNKKRLLSIILAVLAVVVLAGGTFAVVKLIPLLNDDKTVSKTPDIAVLSIKEAEFKTLTVTNKNGTFVLNNKVTKDDDGYDNCEWTLQGYDSEIISDYQLYDVASNFTRLTAIRKITTKTAEQCGFSTPAVVVDIVKQDDSKVNLLVGDKSPDGSGVYVKFANDDTIYLVLDDLNTRLTFTTLDLASTDGIPAVTLPSGYDKYISNGTIALFDSLTISGKNFSKPVVIKPNEDKNTSELHNYVITSPTNYKAENVDKALILFNDVTTVAGAYALDSDQATLNKYGLNNPDLTVSVKLGSLTYTYKFKQQNDGNYAVWYNDCKMIKKVYPEALEILSYSTTNFYSTWIHLQSIDDLSGFIVKSEGKEYKFDINVKKNEDSKNEYTIKYNGKELTATNFQDFYRYCISLYASDFDSTTSNAEPSYEITYVYSDAKRAPTKIVFRRSSTSQTKYSFSVDGTVIGHVNASDINRIGDYVKKVANNEKITVI